MELIKITGEIHKRYQYCVLIRSEGKYDYLVRQLQRRYGISVIDNMLDLNAPSNTMNEYYGVYSRYDFSNHFLIYAKDDEVLKCIKEIGK